MKRNIILIIVVFLFILSFAVATEFKVTSGIATLFQVLPTGTINVSADTMVNGSNIEGIGRLNVSQICHSENITNKINSTWGYFNNGSCIVIGNLKYVSEC